MITDIYQLSLTYFKRFNYVLILFILAPISVVAQDQDELLQNALQPYTGEIIRVNNDIVADLNIAVMMRDGINLYVDIYRPAGNGQYPSLYASAPLPHNQDSTLPNGPQTGSVEWFVNQGYVYILASSRGTGLSEGEYQFLSKDEQQDHYEVIEWIADQSWSNGKVAGAGASYYATSQWFMASQSPPHLECIAPLNGMLSPYQDWAYSGGLINDSFSFDWYEKKIRQANAFPNTGPARIIDFDMRQQQLLHPYYDEFWRLRSSSERLAEITIPTFIMRSWEGTEAGLNSTLQSLSHLINNNKIYIFDNTENYSPLQDQSFLEEELMPFYDWCLNGQQSNSYIEKPSIRYYVKGQDVLKRESSWPPRNIEFTPFFLNKQIVSGEEASSINFSGLPNNISNSAYGLGTDKNTITFISDILEQDIEIAGPLMMELYASSSSTDTAFKVTVSEQIIFPQISQTPFQSSFINPIRGQAEDLSQNNTTVLVSQGHLKASLRTTNPDLSMENQPNYLFNDKSLLVPGQVNRFEISLQSSAYRFKTGNRIMIQIQKAMDDSLSNQPSRDTFYHNDRYPSRLWLPLVQSATASRQLDSNNEIEEINQTIFNRSVLNLDFLNTDSLDETDNLNFEQE